MGSRLVWKGDEVLARVKRAIPEAIDETTQEAAEHAKSEHWWQSHGHLVGEIVNEPAQRHGTKVTGKFGSTQRRGFYGLFLEYREPFLRPAADATFHKLAGKIKRKIRR